MNFHLKRGPLKYTLLRCGSSLASGCKPQICESHDCGYVGHGCWPFCKQDIVDIQYILGTGAQEDVIHHRWGDWLCVALLRGWKQPPNMISGMFISDVPNQQVRRVLAELKRSNNHSLLQGAPHGKWCTVHPIKQTVHQEPTDRASSQTGFGHDLQHEPVTQGKVSQSW